MGRGRGARVCARLGEAGFHICMLGRLERVCHVDKREKVAVTAGPKMGPGHMKGHSQQEMRLEGEVNILYGGAGGHHYIYERGIFCTKTQGRPSTRIREVLP